MRAPISVPTTACRPGTPCSCRRTVTLWDSDDPDLRMPYQHGGLERKASYFHRVGIESLFADLKSNGMRIHCGFFRWFGLRGYALLIGFTLAALNIPFLRD